MDSRGIVAVVWSTKPQGRKLFPMHRFSRIQVLTILGIPFGFSMLPAAVYVFQFDNILIETPQSGLPTPDLLRDPGDASKPERRFFWHLRRHTQTAKTKSLVHDDDDCWATVHQLAD